jgi:integrase
MPTKKLSPAKVTKEKRPGLYGDGGNLYLHIGEAGNRSWIFRFMIDGKARSMGLGAVHTVSLAEARDAALEARKLVRLGIDPIETKDAARNTLRLEKAKSVTFQACAERYIEAHRKGWRNAKHAKQWPATLEAYVYPAIGALPVAQIDTGHITHILQGEDKLWDTKTETAGRVRGRIELVLDYAKARNWRTGENPARWRGHLEHVLPKKSKVKKVKHLPALPWKEVANFMATLSAQEGVAARALEFTILTAARTSETIGARWDEINMTEKVWTIPGARMKREREHRVPLSEAALTVLRKVERDGDLIFPGIKNDSMLTLLPLMGRDDITVHGFRSTFRDWAAETGESSDIAEAALAHALKDKTQAAYQRGDLLDRRHRLMQKWATHCATLPKPDDAKVESLAAHKARRK